MSIEIKKPYRNSLNTIRFLAAISVMYGHICTHMSIEMPLWITAFIGFFCGVPIFFAMSGFLVWQSVERSSTFISYAKKRFWRIYPELWVAIIFELLVMSIFVNKSGGGYYAIFAFTQGTIFQFWTPDVFRSYGCGTPNGSLWTICVIIQFYVLAYFLHKWLHNKKLFIWVITLVTSIVIAIVSPLFEKLLPVIMYKLYRQTLFPYLWMFIIGVMASEFEDKLLGVLIKYWYIFLICSLIFDITNFDINCGYNLLQCSLLVLGLIGLAYAVPVINICTDISYGLYVYHMTVVNAMISMGMTGDTAYLIIAIVVSCLIAWVSTMTIGKWSNKMKKITA